MIRELKIEEYNRCSEYRLMENTVHEKNMFENFKNGNRLIYVYEKAGRLLGEGALVYETGDPDYTIPNQRIYISRMIVDEKHQNQGIGGEIVDFLVAKAHEMGYNEVSIGVDKCNVNALHLYRKKGFTTIIFDGVDEAGEYYKLMRTL